MTSPARSTLDTALRALADGNRRAILSLVRDRPLAVGEIADRTALSEQTVSHHLQVLRGAGLVSERAAVLKATAWDYGHPMTTERDPLAHQWTGSSAHDALREALVEAARR
jgi:predicted transcriptional regulator